MRIPVILALLCALPACSRCQGGPARDVPDERETPRVIVAMTGQPWKQEPVTLRAFEVLDDGFRSAATYPDVIRREHAFPAVSVSGETLYLARGAYLERHSPLEPDGKPVIAELEDVPASLLCSARSCLVGQESRVEHVDFGRRRPRPTTIHEEDQFPKPVDFLVPAGELVVAVDDEVAPKYAFVLEREGTSARYLHTVGLMSGPNETYLDSIAIDGTLVSVAQFGVMDGSGNTLYLWKIGKDPGKTTIVSEYFPEGRGGVEKIIAGEEGSFWNGLGAIDRHLFIGAGTRGILHMDMGDEKGLLHDVGGPVADLLVLEGRIIALVGEGGGERCGEGKAVALVILTWNAKDGSFAEVGHHCSDTVLDRIAF